MFYILILVFLFAVELFYFRLARKYNIIDKPNIRSSHKELTIRGGGIVFPLAMLCYFLIFGFQYPFFHLGLIALSAISFADDIRHQPEMIRFGLHFVCVALLLLDAGLASENWLLGISSLILIVGVVNACNFMDGINGITVGHAAVMIASLWVVNNSIAFIDPDYLICLALGSVVFAFFNFRPRAACFAGDVGSVSVALSLVFPLLLLMMKSNNLIYILFFAVYGIDTVLTLLHRIYKGENILKAHRQHLYQYLANEMRMPHLVVTGIYMGLQAIINVATIYASTHFDSGGQWIFALVLLGLLALLHTAVKFRIIRRLPVMA